VQAQPRVADLIVTALSQRDWLRVAARSHLSEDGEVEEAVQEAHAAIPKRLAAYNGSSTIKTWATSIAKNKAIDIYRRERRRRRPDTRTTPGVNTRNSSVVAAKIDLEDFLNQLPSHLAEALRLREIEGLKHREIADRMNVPLGNVNGYLTQARTIIRRLAGGYEL